jgi:hypothetical protein
MQPAKEPPEGTTQLHLCMAGGRKSGGFRVAGATIIFAAPNAGPEGLRTLGSSELLLDHEVNSRQPLECGAVFGGSAAVWWAEVR